MVKKGKESISQHQMKQLLRMISVSFLSVPRLLLCHQRKLSMLSLKIIFLMNFLLTQPQQQTLLHLLKAM